MKGYEISHTQLGIYFLPVKLIETIRITTNYKYCQRHANRTNIRLLVDVITIRYKLNAILEMMKRST